MIGGGTLLYLLVIIIFKIKRKFLFIQYWLGTSNNLWEMGKYSGKDIFAFVIQRSG